MKTIGINVSGYILKDFGLGVAVRANIKSIEAASISYVVNDVLFEIPKEIKAGQHQTKNLTAENPYPVNLIQINFDNLSRFFSEKGNSYFEDKYNIGFWAWELETLPDEATMFFDFLDEIWVPSNFCAEVIAKYSPVPVIKIMHAIVTTPGEFSRSEYGIPEDKFMYLTMFDYYSRVERKNPMAVIEAFELAFGSKTSDAVLVIKSSPGSKFPSEKNQILDRIKANKNIILIEEILETEKLYGLINSCDCFVSLHRSEGFGLTMAEAMSFGKPLIATDYSGNKDFMDVNNSFAVKYKFVPVGDKYFVNCPGNLWAEADVQHAAELMKFVFENPASAKIVGANAKRYIDEHLSPNKIGAKIAHRLKIIEEEIIPRKSAGSANDLQLLQFEKQILQQKIDALRNLKLVKWKEEFKNLQNKISGRDRKYLWE